MPGRRFSLLLLALWLAACQTAVPPTPSPPNPRPASPTTAPSPSLPSRCRPGSDAQLVYISPDGYCLLYPSTFRLLAGPGAATTFSGPPLDASADAPDRVSLSISVEPTDLALDGWLEAHAGDAPPPSTTLDGVPAAWPAADQLLAVHDGRLYRLTFAPPTDEAGLDIAALKRTTVASFSFLPAGFLARFAHCPTAMAETAVYLNLDDGYCLGYPAAMTLGYNLTLRTLVLSQPVVADGAPVRLSLLINVGGAADGRSLDAVVAAYLADFSPQWRDSVEQMTGALDGRPLAIIDGAPGAARSRQAFALGDGRLYALTLTPYDDPTLTAVQPAADAVWQTAVSSFRFLKQPPD